MVVVAVLAGVVAGLLHVKLHVGNSPLAIGGAVVVLLTTARLSRYPLVGVMIFCIAAPGAAYILTH